MQSSKYLVDNTSGLKKTGSGKIFGFLLSGSQADQNDIAVYDGVGTSASKARINMFVDTASIENCGAVAMSQVELDENNYTNVADGDSITIDGKTYTFKDTPSQIGDVQIGADFAESFTNMSNATIGNSGNYFAGTTPSEKIVLFHNGGQGSKPLFISRGFETTFNNIPISISSVRFGTPDGNFSNSSYTAQPIGNGKITIGNREYYATTVLPENLNTFLGLNLPVIPNVYSIFSEKSGFIDTVNGDGGVGEGVLYSTGTTPHTQVQLIDPNDPTNTGLLIIEALNTGYDGNYIAVSSSIGQVFTTSEDSSLTEFYQTHLLGGSDAVSQVIELLGVSGANSIKLQVPIELNHGLYVEYIGSNDYTILYDGFDT